METICCSAVHFVTGPDQVHGPRNVHKGFVVFGVGHHHCMEILGVMFPDRQYLGHTRSGFMTSLQRYVDRHEALEIARTAGQLKGKKHGSDHELYSEDIFY